jgi:hypothetical protein
MLCDSSITTASQRCWRRSLANRPCSSVSMEMITRLEYVNGFRGGGQDLFDPLHPDRVESDKR